MDEVIINPRREWTEEDNQKLSEYLKKKGYPILRLRIEKMICEQNAELIKKRDLECISRIEVLNTLLHVLDSARD